ncbi:flagellar hook-basal body complex protein FliE [Gottfriedia luciferensis]|uniref:flagellar hook-basal body complex protein FliE n=1 Tax=Gottfriedia luciferensis TaxID=178774 RepID=UPI000B44DDA3|nr:flagellar hook-basal body complex protein FliE [Gottfriedia luciferensis]
MTQISQIQSINMQPLNTGNSIKSTGDVQSKFANFLKDSINQVNEAGIESNDMTNKLVKGENVDLHNVMIAAEKSNIMLQTTMEIRNKVIDAYQEMMRMQI